jgi:hypothetical protein
MGKEHDGGDMRQCAATSVDCICEAHSLSIDSRFLDIIDETFLLSEERVLREAWLLRRQTDSGDE